MTNVVLRCADQRLNEVINKKFTNDLTLAELGGVKWHMARDNMEELFEQVEFAVDHKGTKEVSLVAHTDCALYKELGEDDPDQPAHDLHDAVAQLSERFPALTITPYLYNVETHKLEQIDTDN